jgi:dCTP deaminase
VALSDVTIKNLLDNAEVSIDPFDESRLTPAGYDLAAAQKILLSPGEQKLVATLERVKFPPDLLGILHLRSSFAREGLLASLAIVDPGFRGQLTVSLTNLSKQPVKIAKGEPFLQLTFIKLSSRAKRPYHGHYQESYGVVKSRRRGLLL